MIYYFSGTGNSHWTADNIANTLNDRVISIADAIDKGEYRYKLEPDERIGWVFPIHSWGVPKIVLDFISKWHIDGYTSSTYTYMVCTCGDDIGLSVEMWQKALGGIKGNAAFSLQMPNSYINMKGFDVDSDSVRLSKLGVAKSRIDEISFSIAARRNTVEVVKGKYASLKSKLIYPIFNKFALNDKSFNCDTNLCTSCGKCETSCPTHNIKMQDGHPQWQHHCTMCLSCLHHCPQKAINYGNATQKKGRYHHPDY